MEQAVQKLKIVLNALAEADARIDDDPRAVDTLRRIAASIRASSQS
jgi:hypothetical protein